MSCDVVAITVFTAVGGVEALDEECAERGVDGGRARRSDREGHDEDGDRRWFARTSRARRDDECDGWSERMAVTFLCFAVLKPVETRHGSVFSFLYGRVVRIELDLNN